VRTTITFLSLLLVLLRPQWTEAQAHWTWVVMDASVNESNPDICTFILGLKADSAQHGGRLGNCNIRGSVSGDLADFDGLNDPVLTAFPQDYAATVTDGPDDSDWQINLVLEEGDGLSIDTSAVSVAAVAFNIINSGGHSGLVFSVLQQTFLADYRTAAVVSYDNAGGDISLLPSGFNDRDKGRLPLAFAFTPNYPNPFNASTMVTYDISYECHVRLDVFTSSGQAVRCLVDTRQQPGHYSAVWDGKDDMAFALPSGIYVITLKAGAFFAVGKMILLR